MKVIIDIDEGYYEAIKHDVKINHNDFVPFKLIANGRPFNVIENKNSSFIAYDKSEVNNLDHMYGMDRYGITKHDLSALLEGKILHTTQNGEYAAIIELI